MAEIILTETDRIEYALKAFKRKVQRAGILKDLRARRHYLKPSLARKMKKAAAERRKHRARKSHRD